MQGLLLQLGCDMGLDVWVARNDRSRGVNGNRFSDLPRVKSDLPLQFDEATNKTIELIDVLWLRGNAIVAAFEIECTTSIYSGLLRMADLITMQPNLNIPLYLVAPDERRNKVMTEVNRPTFSRLSMTRMCSLHLYPCTARPHHTGCPGGALLAARVPARVIRELRTGRRIAERGLEQKRVIRALHPMLHASNQASGESTSSWLWIRLRLRLVPAAAIAHPFSCSPGSRLSQHLNLKDPGSLAIHLEVIVALRILHRLSVDRRGVVLVADNVDYSIAKLIARHHEICNEVV